jgi:hypothetical protein
VNTCRVFFHASSSQHWRMTRLAESQQQARTAGNIKMEPIPDYKDWSHESLIQRVTQLEQELKKQNSRFETSFKLLSMILMRL